MSLSRRFWLTLAAVLAIAVGSGGGWAIAQEHESGTGETHATSEPRGDDSATSTEPGESESTSAAEPAGDDTATESEGTASSEGRRGGKGDGTREGRSRRQRNP